MSRMRASRNSASDSRSHSASSVLCHVFEAGMSAGGCCATTPAPSTPTTLASCRAPTLAPACPEVPSLFA
eukprot:scaffold90417_cov21-Tisochrysis_lutea.AAC.2